MSGPIKVALAGIAGYGDFYLDELLPKAEKVGAKLVGVVDPLPQRCRRLSELSARGIPIHSTIQHLFAETSVDLTMIATPIHLHAPQTCLALSHGASVLCEKPLAGTLADAMKMLHAQRAAATRGPINGVPTSTPSPSTLGEGSPSNGNGAAHGKALSPTLSRSTGRGTNPFVAIGFQWSFSQAVQSLKRDIIAGELGRPIQLKSIAFYPRPTAYFRRNDWAGRIRMPGGEGVLDSPVNNATSHFLHNMLYVLGSTQHLSAAPASVQAELYRANDDSENYDTAAIRCRTESGAELLFYTTLAAPQRLGPKLHYKFEKAVVEFDASASGNFIARFNDGRMKSYGQPSLDRHEKIWQCIEAVRSGEPIACGVEAALPHTMCVVAAQEASPIVDLPRELRRHVPLDGDSIVCIDGMHQAMIRCYDRGILPAESGESAWAVASRPFDLARHEATRRRPSPAVVPA